MAQIERRRWVRLSLTIPLFMRQIDCDGRELIEFATGLNISAGGVLLASRHDVPCGEMAALEIPRPVVRVEFFEALTSFKATILRSIPTRHYFLLGMQFESALI